MATAVLGTVIAVWFAFCLKKMYNSFFKGEAACCSNEGCSGCAGGCAMHKAMEDSYRARVEKISHFALKKSIDVDGMTCDKCVARVVRALEKIDGVAVVAVSLEKQSALVGFTKNISNDILSDAIKRAGYKATAFAA